ncbi:MAG: HAD family hydrolase [Candidatus Sericytochromatia bacterium]|nr:HAD family hydrolase [Candidatus Sericytochromatia bacterium]
MTHVADGLLPPALAALEPGAHDWLCLDMFDTLVSRRVHPEDVKRLVCERLARLAAPALGGAQLYAARAALEQRLGEANVAAGHDAEAALPEVLGALWEALPAADRPGREAFVTLGLELEVATECALQLPEPDAVALLERAREAGLGRCLVSDFYLPEGHLRRLLAHHGLAAHFDHVVVSADTLRTKRSGRQYPLVLERLGAPPSRVLMVGDNAEADVAQARAHGLAAHHLDRAPRGATYEAWRREAGDPGHLARALDGLLATRGEPEPFPELALTLFAFTERLHDALLRAGVRDVCFLAREGQLLQRLFDAYQARRAPTPALAIRTHYLEVSRRATFLPSLGPLEAETFETLFRQYRRMSGAAFLRSLGLEHLEAPLAAALGRNLGEEEADWPTSEAFAALRAHPTFTAAYAHERRTRQDALLDILRRLPWLGGRDRLAVVDVGWKGTIQDHLAALLAQRPDAGVREVEGYYLGLVATGAASPTSRKHGVLFDTVGAPTPHAAAFDQNRSLFEVVLAADHGSTHHHAFDAAGLGVPVRDAFEEAPLFHAHIAPAQRRLEARFAAIDAALVRLPYAPERLLHEAARRHARMVLAPSPAELGWFSGVWHLENFGVFGRSTFSDTAAPPGWREQLAFAWWLLTARRPGELGFWPYLTIRARGGRALAAVYARALRRRAGL